MSRYVIILSPVINTPIDLRHVFEVIDTFSDISEWSVDLDDCDKILRVVCNEDIGRELVKGMARLGIISSVLEVFDENGISII
ncbi:hypothetical protein [Pedobacter sp. V48]|uniref:hypothetical protein n=1 Tax=Pedobacter sp. V48 TaxID=509635 RepID=UPI0003E509A5|nr:hypothetical protein [Pedobacter sp. V48]ETZ20735.1 hypothetical protein N824_03880 [Pedobacter sp. V48]